MKALSRRVLCGMAAVAAAAAIMVPSAAFAQGGPPAGHGNGSGRGHGVGGGRGNGGGGGPGGEETTSNNLSVPAIFVGGDPFNLTCDGTTYNPPTGTPEYFSTADVPGYYYVQGLSSWQAQCNTATSESVTANWGDNLAGGTAKLSTGSPIRVEMGLTDTTASMYGYKVAKLEPLELDRVSQYGTLATQAEDGTFSANLQSFPLTETVTNPETGQQESVTTYVRVYDFGATFSVKNDDTGQYVVSPGTTMSAEINATGAVVYGYNLRVTTAGEYTIEFNTTTDPDVSIAGTNAGTILQDGQPAPVGHTASITFNVTSGGGRGAGNRS